MTLLYKFVNNLAVFPEAPLTFRAVNYPYSTRNVHNLSFCNLYGHTLQYLHSYFPDTISYGIPYLIILYLLILCIPILSIMYINISRVYFVLVLVWLHIHLAPSCIRLVYKEFSIVTVPSEKKKTFLRN